MFGPRGIQKMTPTVVRAALSEKLAAIRRLQFKEGEIMRVLVIALTAALSACATTNITSFTDPDFKGHKYKSFVVVTPNLNLEYADLLQSKICTSLQGSGAACTRALDMFPPTRSYDGSQIAQVLQSNGISGYLVVSYGGGASSAQQVGALHYGTATVYANTVTAYGSSVPITSFSRSDGYGIVLVDTQTFNKAWVGGAKTHAQGLANITDNVFTSSLANEIAQQLAAAGFLE